MAYYNIFLKGIKNKSIQYSLRLALVLLITIFFLNQLSNSYRWGSRIFGRHGRLYSNENAWYKTKHGGLAAFSVFLKEYLFTEFEPNQVLVVPDRRATQNSFVRKLWVKIPSIYLFPTKVMVSDQYRFELSEKEINKLKDHDIITSTFRGNRYHLISTLRTSDYSKWVVYIYNKENKYDVFILPEEFLKTTGIR